MRLRAGVRALTDPEVRAVFLARGGYGVQRILKELGTLPENLPPKPVVGFSDNTALRGGVVRDEIRMRCLERA